ncbi:MAG: DnaD domain protein [Eubacteriales bacterium]
MSRLTIHNNRNNHTTIISNRFIDIYMKEANDAQLKIYIYLLRMTNTDHFTSILGIADQFNHTETDVIRSLEYWAAKDLLSLDYNESGAIISISLKEFKEEVKPETVTTEGTQILPAPSIIEEHLNKSAYSLDQLQTFQKTDDVSQLLFVAEQYLGKTLTSNDLRSIYYIHDELHFDHDLIDFLIQYCVERGKKDFRYIEAVARNWYELNIKTPKEAVDTNTRHTNVVYTIMKSLGKSNDPTDYEISYIRRWTEEYQFNLNVIQEACNRTVQKTDSNRFRYADSILSNWHQQNVTTIEDIQMCDQKYRQSKVPTTNTTYNKPKNSFKSFEQNTYDYDALEATLLMNH